MLNWLLLFLATCLFTLFFNPTSIWFTVCMYALMFIPIQLLPKTGIKSSNLIMCYALGFMLSFAFFINVGNCIIWGLLFGLLFSGIPVAIHQSNPKNELI